MTSDRWLGLFFAAFALLLLLLWIPLDVETGYIEKVRRSTILGDSLGPSVAGVIILLGAILTWTVPSRHDTGLTRNHLTWITLTFALLAVSLTVMRYAGPLITSIFSDTEYRALRTTLPWSYIGFTLGGTVLISGLTCLVERRISASRVLIALLATLLIAMLYDLPFEDLLLPPNGDV